MTVGGEQTKRREVAPVLRQRSRELRQAMPDPEQVVWRQLRAHRFHGLGFRRQVPIAGYIVDFVCHERRLIIEIDGGTHGADDTIRRDETRTRRLEGEGYEVVRYWNNDVMGNIDGVLLDLSIRLGLEAPSPSSLSSGEKGR